MKKSRSSSSNLPSMLGDLKPSDLVQYERQSKVLLYGNAVFTTMETSSPIPAAYITQPARLGVGQVHQLLGRKGASLRVSVSAPIINGLPKTRLGLAIDGYLAWGYRQRKATVLIGGGPIEDGVMLDVLTFDGGMLKTKESRILPQLHSELFKESLQSIIEQIREVYPGYRISMAAPLPDLEIEGVNHTGDSALRGVSYRPLAAKEKKATLGRYKLHVVMVAASFGVYAFSLFTGWNRLAMAKSEYDFAASSQAIVESGGVDPTYLNILQQRRRFLEHPRRQMLLANKAGQIVSGIATVPDVRIIELRLPAPNISGEEGDAQGAQLINPEAEGGATGDRRAPDVAMTISVPSVPGPALAQARDVMMTIGQATGMDLRLAHQGVRESTGTRVFQIEGMIRD